MPQNVGGPNRHVKLEGESESAFIRAIRGRFHVKRVCRGFFSIRAAYGRGIVSAGGGRVEAGGATNAGGGPKAGGATAIASRA